MATESSSSPVVRQDGHSLGFNLGAIALLVFMLALALAYAVDAAGRSAREAQLATYSRTLGGRQLEIPAGWLREDAGPGDAFAKQVEMQVLVALGPRAALRPIDITLVPRSRARPSASLLDGVYLHQFMPEQLSGPPGLIGKPLMAREGYENETVWYDPLSPAPFVAKCSAPLVEGEPGNCLRTVFLSSGIAAIYSFGDDVLANWQSFDVALAVPLKHIGAL